MNARTKRPPEGMVAEADLLQALEQRDALEAELERTRTEFAPNLSTAWLRARRRIAPIAKGSTAKVQSNRTGTGYTYQFTSSEEMVEACLDALLAEGLTWSLVAWDVGEPLIGYQCPTLWATFELVFVADESKREFRFPMPIASRNDADKAVAGALTYLLGQSLRAVLMVPKSGGDDQDPDKRTREYGGHAWGGDAPRATTRATAKPAAPAKPKGADLGPLRAKVRSLASELKDRTGATWGSIAKAAELSNPSSPSPEDLRKAKTYLESKLDEIEAASGWQTTPKPEDESQAPDDEGDAPEPYDPGDGKGDEVPAGVDPETGEVFDEDAFEREAIRAEANGELDLEGA